MTFTDATTTGLLIHGFGTGAGGQLSTVFRSALNAAAAMPGAAIEIVIQGPAVALLSQGSDMADSDIAGSDIAGSDIAGNDTVGSDLSGSVGEAREQGIAVFACENSMRSAGVERDRLLPGVGFVPAAVAHLAQRQWDGWAYIRL